MHWLILCNECVDEQEDDIVLNAEEGFQDQGQEISVLACQKWHLPHDDNALQFFCDECPSAVAVDPRSLWFIEEHRKEREEVWNI